MNDEEVLIISRLFDRMAKAGVSMTTGTTTTATGTQPMWEWWDWANEPARGHTVTSLRQHLEDIESRER